MPGGIRPRDGPPAPGGPPAVVPGNRCGGGVACRAAGDAEDLPFEEGAFDVVASLIGAMFAPRPERAAAEMLRVCRPGGRTVMGNWTPDGFVGAFFRTVGAHVPPPEMPSPLLWGTEAAVRERFGDGVSELTATRTAHRFDYPWPPERVVAHYRKNFDPVIRAVRA
jgi:SAM-dependent methyltransferase